MRGASCNGSILQLQTDGLLALGPPYQPIRNLEGHTNALAYFKQQNREPILASLRKRFLNDFRAGQPLSTYARLKSLDSLTPDPLWLDLCDTPTDVMLAGQTDQWLAAVGATPFGTVDSELPPIDEVRRENSKVLDAATHAIAAVIPVWCWKNNYQTPTLWTGADPSTQVRQMADAECLLDFEPLSAAHVISWLKRKGYWPQNMPETTDRDTLGLTLADVERRERQIAVQKSTHDFERRSIEINHKRLLAEPENYAAIAEFVSDTINARFLASPRGVAKLAEIEASRGRRGAGGSGWGGGSSARRLTDQQRGAIGLVGEVLAFRWLKHQYGDDVNDDSWKSSYRSHVLGGSVGTDSLGL